MAETQPKEIGYVECHCTGTEVGDAIEIAGLKKAYESLGERPEAIPIGSIKGNIGHANCAAGITGLIKTLSMMETETLVPVANYDKLNPKLRLEQTCFQVQTSVAPWTGPRKAGVSAFGIGGTNCHVVLEAPEDETAVEKREIEWDTVPPRQE